MISLYILGAYFLIFNLSYGVLLALSWINVKENLKSVASWPLQSQIIRHSPERPLVTVIIPAHNEGKVIVSTVSNYLKLDYDALEILVVDDGSSDDTCASLEQSFGLKRRTRYLDYEHHPSVQIEGIVIKLIKQKNAGKASALNHGLQHARGEFILTADADTVPAVDAITRLLSSFSDPEVMAAGGAVKVLNGSSKQHGVVERGVLPSAPLLICQVLEYIRAFYCGRVGWDLIKGTALLSGAFSMFRKDALDRIGGFNAQSITEDLEVVVRMKNFFERSEIPCKIVLQPYPLCWTEVPEKISHLYRQRLRWQQGLIETLKSNLSLVGNRRQENTGMIVLPYMVGFEILGPLMELLAYIAIGISLTRGLISPNIILAMMAAGVSYSFIYTALAVLMEEHYFSSHRLKNVDLIKLLIFTVLENFGLRQLLCATRFMAYYALFKQPKSWGTKVRYQGTHLPQVLYPRFNG